MWSKKKKKPQNTNHKLSNNKSGSKSNRSLGLISELTETSESDMCVCQSMQHIFHHFIVWKGLFAKKVTSPSPYNFSQSTVDQMFCCVMWILYLLWWPIQNLVMGFSSQLFLQSDLLPKGTFKSFITYYVKYIGECNSTQIPLIFFIGKKCLQKH